MGRVPVRSVVLLCLYSLLFLAACVQITQLVRSRHRWNAFQPRILMQLGALAVLRMVYWAHTTEQKHQWGDFAEVTLLIVPSWLEFAALSQLVLFYAQVAAEIRWGAGGGGAQTNTARVRSNEAPASAMVAALKAQRRREAEEEEREEEEDQEEEERGGDEVEEENIEEWGQGADGDAMVGEGKQCSEQYSNWGDDRPSVVSSASSAVGGGRQQEARRSWTAAKKQKRRRATKKKKKKKSDRMAAGFFNSTHESMKGQHITMKRQRQTINVRTYLGVNLVAFILCIILGSTVHDIDDEDESSVPKILYASYFGLLDFALAVLLWYYGARFASAPPRFKQMLPRSPGTFQILNYSCIVVFILRGVSNLATAIGLVKPQSISDGKDISWPVFIYFFVSEFLVCAALLVLMWHIPSRKGRRFRGDIMANAEDALRQQARLSEPLLDESTVPPLSARNQSHPDSSDAAHDRDGSLPIEAPLGSGQQQQYQQHQPQQHQRYSDVGAYDPPDTVSPSNASPLGYYAGSLGTQPEFPQAMSATGVPLAQVAEDPQPQQQQQQDAAAVERFSQRLISGSAPPRTGAPWLQWMGGDTDPPAGTAATDWSGAPTAIPPTQTPSAQQQQQEHQASSRPPAHHVHLQTADPLSQTVRLSLQRGSHTGLTGMSSNSSLSSLASEQQQLQTQMQMSVPQQATMVRQQSQPYGGNRGAVLGAVAFPNPYASANVSAQSQQFGRGMPAQPQLQRVATDPGQLVDRRGELPRGAAAHTRPPGRVGQHNTLSPQEILAHWTKQSGDEGPNTGRHSYGGGSA